MNKTLQIGIIALLLVALVTGVNVEPVTWIEDNRKITLDEEAGTVTIEPYQSPINKFLSFFSISPPLTVVPQDTVKENVGEFYRAAGENRWTRWIISINQEKAHGGGCGYYEISDCPSGAIYKFVNSPCLRFSDLCRDVGSSQTNALNTLSFSLKDQCFYCYEYPGSGGSGYHNCLVTTGGRQLTLNELWMPELRQRAVDLGYTVKESYEAEADGSLRWGIWGATSNEACNNFVALTKETGVGGSASMYSSSGGYIFSFRAIYAYGMAEITQPICEPEAVQCQGDNLEKCSDNRKWVVVETCEFGCSAGACNADPCLGVNCSNYCSDSTLFYDGLCSGGNCEYSQMSCEFGCLAGECNPDPCEGVTCSNYCSGKTLFYNGYCLEGSCIYSQRECQYECSAGACDYSPPIPKAWVVFPIVGLLIVAYIVKKKRGHT